MAFKSLLVVLALALVGELTQAQNAQQHVASLGTCPLENGETITDCRVGYRTFGTLDAARDNAVLMPSWLYGTSADLGQFFSAEPTSTRLVDTSRFFGVAFDSFGNGISSSPSNSMTQHGPGFPHFTTADMVRAEYRVATEVLHLRHAHAVLGLSMGGEQTFMWAALYPTFFDLAVPIISTPRLTAWDLQSKRIMLEAIRSDPGFHDGHYTTQPALRLANLYNNQAVTSPESRNREVPYSSFEAFVARAEAPIPNDANDRVYQLEAVVHHDALRGRTIEQAAQAAQRGQALHLPNTPVSPLVNGHGPNFLIVVNANDRMVVPSEALQWAAAIHAPTYISQAPCAHLIMTCDAQAVATRVENFLSRK